MRFWSTITGAWYSVRYGIPNLIRWLPLIWRDRDWDWQYLAVLMRQKLLWMVELEEKYGHHVSSESDAKKQRVCAELLRRVIEDSYAETGLIAAGLDPRQTMFTYEPTNHGGYKTLWFTRADGRDESELRRRIYLHAEKQRSYDMKYFGHLLGKHLLSWWD